MKIIIIIILTRGKNLLPTRFDGLAKAMIANWLQGAKLKEPRVDNANHSKEKDGQ